MRLILCYNPFSNRVFNFKREFYYCEDIGSILNKFAPKSGTSIFVNGVSLLIISRGIFLCTTSRLIIPHLNYACTRLIKARRHFYHRPSSTLCSLLHSSSSSISPLRSAILSPAFFYPAAALVQYWKECSSLHST